MTILSKNYARFLIFFSIVISYVVYKNLESLQSSPNNQPYRTGYHFQPIKNWMNAKVCAYSNIGPMIYKGIYHLFYQHNPNAAVWNELIVWGHSTSTDMINWVHQPVAMFPSQPSDINGCWSGSATILPEGKPVILYTGHNEESQEVQNLAIPKNLEDPYLIEWVKVPQNPLMAPTSINKINPNSFRDPSTAWLGIDGEWRVIIGSQNDSQGMAIMYHSKDFINWEQTKRHLCSSPKTGIWECPDFFPVSSKSPIGLDTSMVGDGIRHVLKVSLFDKHHDYYYIGDYNLETDTFIPDWESVDSIPGLRFDYGKFYASKTFFDSEKNRRILWGWINESSSTHDDIKKGWSGIQAIPRTIWLDKSGKQVMQWPIPEVESLRIDPPITFRQGQVLKSGSVFELIGVTAAQIDHSVVESFGGHGKTCITARVYPTLAIDDRAHLYVFNYGTETIPMSILVPGPMIYMGVYHLFYQYNPRGAVWGNIVWAHSTSTDLINWIPQPEAFSPSHPFDAAGCWSGSTTILSNTKPVILYTGINRLNQQVQNLAIPKNLSDPYLREWTKIPQNPLMSPTILNQINSSSFRDPTTAWLGHDGRWRVIIGSKIDRQGMAILYHSNDFLNWTLSKNSLHSSNNTGMWECPDFFPVSTKSSNGLPTSTVGDGVKHVLKVSIDDNKHDYYYVGNYILENDTFVPDEETVDSVPGLRYDYGKYYGSKTFFDSVKQRRILWGWINESSSTADDIIKGWSGIMAIPRTIWLDKSGKQLIQWPVAEVETLRGKQVDMANKALAGGTMLEISGITATQADVETTFEVSELEKAEVFDPSWTDPQLLCCQKGTKVKGGVGPFGLLVLASDGLKEYTAVYYRVFRSEQNFIVLMCSEQSSSSLNQDNDKTTYGAFLDVDPVHEKLSLRTLIDHSVIESFGGYGKTCITARVYPTLAIDDKAHLYKFNHGNQTVTISRLSAWSMKRAHIN
ncbi:Glycosyl hydrolase family 32, C-terminal [Dillenia turbinata]|uniref:Glycosyl hydrolase family 32, C-terminal n=1 Tax=Dillenia turbinata TaxID=194707 RepID=A0AAN8UJY9_9MAGN